MYLGIFNRMLSDDYCTTYQAQRLGLLRSMWFWYITWHGGISANVLDWFISLWGSKGFSFFTLAYLSIWVIAAVLAAKEILQLRGYSPSSLFPALLLGVFLIFATLLTSPDVEQSAYWWGAARNYLPPLILILFYAVLYRRFIVSSLSRTQRGIWLFISFGFVLFMAGFNETFTPILIVFLVGVMGMIWLLSKSSTRRLSLLFLGISLLGTLSALVVIVLAPGNASRQSFYPPPPDLFTLLRITSEGYFTFLHDIFSSPMMLTGLLGVILGSVWLGIRVNREYAVPAPRGGWIVALLLTGFAFTFGCFPSSVYATSTSPAPRVLITATFLLALFLLASSFVFGEWLANHSKDSSIMQIALLIVACGLIVFSSRGAFQNLSSMRAEHAAFAQKWDQVDAKIKEAKDSGLEQVDIPSMRNWARAQFPTDNPRYYPNICYSKFYDIQIFAPPLQ
jgi:hypothetical protein